jgi:hypothetical protein
MGGVCDRRCSIEMWTWYISYDNCMFSCGVSLIVVRYELNLGRGHRYMIWYVIWYDTIWYDMIRYDMIRYDIWYDICDMIWYDKIWYDMICDMILYDTIWYDMKVKVPLNRPEVPEGGTGIAVLFPDLGARRRWVVSTTPRPLYPRERPSTHCTGGWVSPRAGLDDMIWYDIYLTAIGLTPGGSSAVHIYTQTHRIQRTDHT